MQRADRLICDDGGLGPGMKGRDQARRLAEQMAADMNLIGPALQRDRHDLATGRAVRRG